MRAATKKGGLMSKPIRVEGWAYVPGPGFSTTQFLSQAYARVRRNFTPFGGVSS